LPGYQTIAVVAAGLRTNEERLLDFHRKGWLDAVDRNNVKFLASDQRYRAKYILHLYEVKHLSDEQIQLVLSVQRPPYSAAQVDEILKQSVPSSTSKDGGS
jgi:hypothetical protein